jgi:hypothetical protein
MNSLFENVLHSDNIIEEFVTPITPYFLCNHFISDEIHCYGYKYFYYEITVKGNDLLRNKNFHDIKHLDIIQIQVDYFDYFHDVVLPIIVSNNIQVIIITSQWHSPQIQHNEKTMNVLNNKNILLWISQNPIYANHDKYMAFPYGILHHNLKQYVDFVKSYDKTIPKNIKILNQHSGAHDHLPSNHVRKIYPIFGINSGPPLEYNDFLKNIADSEYVISTIGDREDCYRHYESIGLNAIPISNISNNYKDIFQDNMIYSNAEEMITMINTQSIESIYQPPNRDILTVRYWVEKIRERIEFCKKQI